MNTRVLAKIGVYIFPVLTLVFACVYFGNESLYRELISEDNIVEWFTFLFLWLTGILSTIAWYRIRRAYGYHQWFFILFAGFAFLAGLEEISWGQRIFRIESTEFFNKYNDQKETNLHNTFQGIFQVKTKHIALLGMFIYGVVFPWLMQRNRLNKRIFNQKAVIIPPYFLVTGFIFATIMMFDFQTGYEEEIGELYFSMCFCIMLWWELWFLKQRQKT
jgi:hypothetical protein